jgi:hypothetical protein
MMGFRRFRFALLLAVGLTLVASPAAWALKAQSEQIMPDGLDDTVSVTGGSSPRQGLGGQPEGVAADAAALQPRADRVVLPMPSLRELLKSIWLVTWSTGLLP